MHEKCIYSCDAWKCLRRNFRDKKNEKVMEFMFVHSNFCMPDILDTRQYVKQMKIWKMKRSKILFSARLHT